jgi:hypothetical protein
MGDGMDEDAEEFRIVYRGLTEQTAERLLKENVFTNKGFTDTTYNPWNACEPLDEKRRNSYHNLMAINLSEGIRGLHVPEQEMIVLQSDLTLKCIGVTMFPSAHLTRNEIRPIRLFAMVVK